MSNHNETIENGKILMNSGCVVTDENGENIIVSSEKAGKLNNPYEESSVAHRNVENSVMEIFKRLRKEKN